MSVTTVVLSDRPRVGFDSVDRVTPTVDELSEQLDAVRVRSVVYCRSELGAPWGFRVAASAQAKFHLVLLGTARLWVADNDSEVDLAAGDLVLLPHGSAHVIRDALGSRVRDLDRILEDHPVDGAGTMHYGGRGPKTLLVCGGFDTVAFDALLGWLPPLAVTDTANGLGRWLDPMTDLVRGRGGSKPGDAAVMAKVADVFLTDVLRTYLAHTGRSLPKAAHSDPVIAEVLAVIHRRAREPWTIATLAREVGISRSSLAARFHASVGMAPMAYLTRLRLARAAGDLAASTRPLAQVARASGYDNESSFSKAFARHYGQPPGQYRQNSRREPRATV
jgi:AraC-like DNA-binding protein